MLTGDHRDEPTLRARGKADHGHIRTRVTEGPDLLEAASSIVGVAS
jgi:hypothetical protein